MILYIVFKKKVYKEIYYYFLNEFVVNWLSEWNYENLFKKNFNILLYFFDMIIDFKVKI